MKYLLIFIFTINFLQAQNNFEASFITPYEYGKMLYKNPRGISCVKCHGEDAKGKVIVAFEHKRKSKTYNCKLQAPDITNISYQEFIQSLDAKIEKPKPKFAKDEYCKKLTYGNSMPKYFLTKEELRSIYFYLSNKESGKYE